MFETNIDDEEANINNKKTTKSNSPPKSNPSSPISSGMSLSTSQLHEKPQITDKDKPDEKKSHSIWGLFGRKHQPPNTLDLHKSSKSSKESSTTPSSSLGFLHRLSFIKHSPATTPHSNYPEQYSEATLSRPTDLLTPVKELENLEKQEEKENEEINNSGNEEQWFVPAVHENELEIDIENEVEGDVTTQKIDDNERTRDATIKELENFLNDFRSGKLRALNDDELEEMRNMHREQLELSMFQMKIHDLLMQNDVYDSDKFDDMYKKLSDQLDKLHNSMENFGTQKTPKIKNNQSMFI